MVVPRDNYVFRVKTAPTDILLRLARGLARTFDVICNGPPLLEALHAPKAEYLLQHDPICFSYSSVTALGGVQTHSAGCDPVGGDAGLLNVSPGTPKREHITA
jgi:hypothetical protein